MTVKKICPNKTIGRGGKNIDYIVIHWIGIGTLESANIRFQNASSKVSAHYGISDNTIYQWVEEKDTAYHAGVWDINQRSIGIEYDATTTKNASEETYNTSGQLIREICQRHNIPIDREHIKGHKEFKATQCPGTLDLDKIISIAKRDIIPHMTLEEQNVLRKLKTYEEEAGHGNLEGAMDTLLGNVKELRDAKESISNLNKDISALKADVDYLDNQMDDFKTELSEYRRLESVWQSAISSAKSKESKLLKQINEIKLESNVWKNRYEVKCKETTDKYTGWELIGLGLRKLLFNKK